MRCVCLRHNKKGEPDFPPLPPPLLFTVLRLQPEAERDGRGQYGQGNDIFFLKTPKIKHE